MSQCIFSKTNSSWVCVTERLLVQPVIPTFLSQNSVVELFFLYMQQNSPVLSVRLLVFSGTHALVTITISLEYFLTCPRSSIDPMTVSPPAVAHR